MRKLPKIFRLPLAALVLLSATSLALSQSPAPSPLPSRLPVISDDTLDDFGDLQRNLVTLEARIAKVKRLIAASQDANGPESKRAAFRTLVAGLLDAFGDGGQVSTLGQTAVDLAKQRLDEAKRDTSFPPEQKEALIIRWRRLAMQTEALAATLDGTRKDLLEKLELLQSKADFVDQMEKLRQARAVLDAVGDLADQRQSVSDRVRDLLQGRPSNGSGM